MGVWRSVFAVVLATTAMQPALAQPQDLVPIVTYDQSHPLVEQSDAFPMVRVYATGDVIIYRAAGNRNPGIFELTLDDEELAEIINLAQQAGVAQFDEAALVDSPSENPDGMLRQVTDPTISIFEFNRVQGQSSLSTGDGSTPDELQTVMIRDVATTVSATTDSLPLGPLSTLHERLLELFTMAGR